MSTCSNADTLDLNNCRVFNIGCEQINNLGSEQEINLFGEEEENDFKKELLEVLKEISKRLYAIEVEIANK